MPKGASVVPLPPGSQGSGSASSSRAIDLTVNIQMNGIVDFNAMSAAARQQAVHIRDALRKVESDYS